jgi:Tfp pilus assembly protein FimT
MRNEACPDARKSSRIRALISDPSLIPSFVFTDRSADGTAPHAPVSYPMAQENDGCRLQVSSCNLQPVFEGPQYQRNDEKGFSLVEIGITLLLFALVSGFALLKVNTILPGMASNTAMKQTLAQLRKGRDLAIAQRRNIEIRFQGANQIQLVRYEVPTGTSIISTLMLEGKNEFRQFDGIPDTPDVFGNGSAISFSGLSPWIFLSDGTMVDSSSNPVNGTVFLGQANNPKTARAVTILGATGRVRDYTWNGTAWFH